MDIAQFAQDFKIVFWLDSDTYVVCYYYLDCQSSSNLGVVQGFNANFDGFSVFEHKIRFYRGSRLQKSGVFRKLEEQIRPVYSTGEPIFVVLRNS